MAENTTPTTHKKRLINKKNRSAWAISIFFISLMALRLVAGIARPTSSRLTTAASATPVFTEQDQAQAALETFFNLLAEKRYEAAAPYFGGSYETLAAVYPLDAIDEAHLLQALCDHVPCLPIHSVTDVQPEGPDGFIFMATFAGEDGRLFTQPAADGRLVSKFSISIVKQNGRYLVQNLPIT